MVLILNKLVLNDNSINIEEWNKIIKKIKDKKIVIFGAGNNGILLNELLAYKVSYFIDNSSQKLHQKIGGLLIHSPEKLRTESDEVAVLVSGYQHQDMVHQLKSMKLGNNILILNVYKVIERYVNRKAFSLRSEEFIDFLERLPQKSNSTVEHVSKEKISVVISNFLFCHYPWHLITIAIMLSYRGENIDIIWDDLEGYDDLYYNWDGATRAQNEVIGDVLDFVKEKFKINVIKVSQISDDSLDEEDMLHLKELANLNTYWKYKVSFFSNGLIEYQKKCYHVLEKSLKKIKRLIKNIKVDRVIIFTGLHGKAGLYTWSCKRSNVQVCSYDTVDRGVIISVDGEASHQMDIRNIIKKNILDDEIKQRLIDYSKDHFSKRLKAVDNREKGEYQVVKYSHTEDCPQYDVVIPLNIAWDAAALGKHRFFNSTGEWVFETVEFILKNTTASVAVRQHPAEKKFASGMDIKEGLYRYFNNNPKFSYISSEDKINTYNIIEKSKLVLPHTSTIGIEAALLGKCVLLESDAYYSDMKFVQKAVSKEDYFKSIKINIESKSNSISASNMEEALLNYGILNFNILITRFTHDLYYEWMKFSFEELMNLDGVDKILSTFSTGKPVAMIQLEEYFKNH